MRVAVRDLDDRDLVRARVPGDLVRRQPASIVVDRYPELRVDLTLRDQFVDPIAEGLDLVVRMGPAR